jgi:RNA polymerase sigma factor (sigma-70 family)
LRRDIFTAEVLTNSRRQVIGFVLKNSGSLDDANDILQEGFETYIINLQKPDFELYTKPEAYIFCVCRNLWLNRLNAEKRNIDDGVELEDLPFIEDEQINLKKRKEILFVILERNIKRLSQRCQDVFQLRKEGLSCEQIARKMQLKAGQISKNKFYSCKKRLLEIISEDQDYLDFKRSESI